MLRARIETVLAVLFTVAAIATAVWPRWMETLTGLEPDGGSGGTEWQVVVALGLAAIAAAFLARRHHRLARDQRGVA